jgi:superfamily II DNA/RNA helicase
MTSIFRYVVDNIGGNNLANVLVNTIEEKSYCSIATAYFMPSGFDIVADKIENCLNFRLLLGSEPGADPLRATIADVWKNIDIHASSKQAERAVRFFSRPDVQIRLFEGKFFHGKTYILNHPSPEFVEITKNTDETFRMTEGFDFAARHRPTELKFIGSLPKGTSRVTAIVGSSNFTYGGLIRNAELNLVDPSGQSLVELLTWFEERWRESTDIKDNFIKLLQGYYKPFLPFWIYAKALWELYREDLEGPGESKPGSTIELADFQAAGFKSAKRILNKWNGALISDAPGMGKTYIAGKVLEEFAYYHREPALIICPAEVERTWIKFIHKYNIPLPKIIHTEVLGHGIKNGIPKLDPQEYKDYSIILVDESHHFRNPQAGRYIWLQQLMSLPKPQVKTDGKLQQIERKMLFVSATPVNNSVWDIYWQLRLIFGEKLSEIAARVGISDLIEYFKGAEEGIGNIYDLIELVAVRRSRRFLREYYPNAMLDGKKIKFPEREPVNLTYNWHKSVERIYAEATDIIENCRLTPYRFESYKLIARDETKVRRGELLSFLFRVLLLKRLESSLWAFRQTVNNLVKLFEDTKGMLENGYIMQPSTLREFMQLLKATSTDENSDDAISPSDFQTLDPNNFEVERMIIDLESDIAMLRMLLTAIPDNMLDLRRVDEKLKMVVKELAVKPQKIIIFSAFMDTANYLFESLRNTYGSKLRIGLVTGDGAKIWDKTKEIGTNRDQIIKQFSPKSNDVLDVKPEEEIELLISTDVLSESINLQDASAVLNYDLPWNPMKIVQRTGRIDRIGSEHDKITIYNVFTETGLESILGLMERLSLKIAQAHRSVGLEVSLLGEEPLPVDFVALERLRSGDKQTIRQLIIDLERKMEGLVGLDPQEQLLAILQTLSKEEIEKIPDGAGSITKVVDRTTDKDRKAGLFVAYRKKQHGELVDRIWRFYPAQDTEKKNAITNKTEIVTQIQFPKTHNAEDRIGEESLHKLKEARTSLEQEFAKISAERRTVRITGNAKKAFQLVQKAGRADLDKFLQISWQKPAVEKVIRGIDFNDEYKAIDTIEQLFKKYGSDDAQDENNQSAKEPESGVSPTNKDDFETELPPLPAGYDPELELVCWMHIID